MNASLDAARLLSVLGGRAPLVLAPSDERGWFGGRALVAFDPIDAGVLGDSGDGPLAEAGAVLERAFFADRPMVAVAALGYPDGVGRWALYDAGLERRAGAWKPWGRRLAESEVPQPPSARESAARGGEAADRGPLATDLSTSLDRDGYCAAIEATRQAILAGDVYVLNVTRSLSGQTALSAPELFAEMCSRAPAAMSAAWLPASGAAVLSASPERFVRVTGHEAEIAPVKGTRPRGTTPAEDAAFIAQLSSDEKERAEHVMIVDLERNDLGRACVAGSIRVDPLCEVETIGYCHQMVSSVRGLLRPEATLGELLEATFPCGSVTGAPKIAAMRIAERLEPVPRGLYTGALIVARPGRIDSSVLIRTAELDGTNLRYGTGCGITVDSDAEAEWEESVLKTRPLLGNADGHER